MESPEVSTQPGQVHIRSPRLGARSSRSLTLRLCITATSARLASSINKEDRVALAPIELLVIGFPGNRFTGGILPELETLVENGVITVVDALLIMKDEDGTVDYLELDQIDPGEDIAALWRLLMESNGLLSHEDVEEFAAALEPGSSAAALVFEHTWFAPLRDEIVDSGGILLANVRIPGLVVDEVLAAVAELEDE